MTETVARPALKGGGGVATRASGRAALAMAAGVAVVVLSVAGVALIAAHGGAAGPNGKDYTAGQAIAGLSYGLAGAALLHRGTALALGVVALGIGLAESVTAALLGLALHGWNGPAGASPPVEAAIWASMWLWVPAYLAIPTLLLLFLPDGRLLSPRWRPVAVTSAMACAFGAVGMALERYPYDDIPREFANASNPFHAQAVADLAGIALPLVLVPSVALALAAFVLRYRRSSGFERDQMKWVLLGGVSTLILLAASFAFGSSGDIVFALGMVPLPAGVAVAVLRHGMWDVDLVINRSIVYGVLTAIVIGVYVAIVSLVTELVARPVAGVVAVALVALAFHPLHARVQRAVNRLIYGDRDDPAAALRRLGERLVGAGEVDEVLPAAAETVARALRLPHVRVSVDGGSGASYGEPSGDPLTIALLYRGRHVGDLSVSPRERGADWSKADLRALQAIGRQVAVAAHAVRLSEDLRRSRERLVLAREEERRRIRRDLHDELGPRLAALALELDTAREEVRSDPERVDAVLGQAAARAREGIADVRRLVYDLRPPTLDDFGLAGALREQADRLSGDGLSVSVVVEREPGPLPAAVEAAAYRIASEAMTNVVRHAGATNCVVTLMLGDARLFVGVADDGHGIDGDAVHGLGLDSMRERAEELGGSFEIAPRAPGGTRVLAVLPLGVR
jgi:two-component system NarL family sensor kinase